MVNYLYLLGAYGDSYLLMYQACMGTVGGALKIPQASCGCGSFIGACEEPMESSAALITCRVARIASVMLAILASYTLRHCSRCFAIAEWCVRGTRQ